MKVKLFIVIQLLMVAQVRSQVPSDCQVPAMLASEYHRDIVQLATYRLFEIKSPDTVMVRIPAIYTDSILHGMSAIFNATGIPERDSVFNLYCVHNINGWPGEYNGVLLAIDTNFAWTQAWENLITMTGNAFLDSMLVNYSLHIDAYFPWTFGTYALLGTDSSWNIPALIDSLLMTPGITAGEPNRILAAAGRITYSTLGDARYYNFFFEFNDCFDGCDNVHIWKYKVNADCSVEYLGFEEWGFFGVLPLPPPLNCNTFTAVSEPITADAEYLIYPNPVSDFLTIQPKKEAAGTIFVLIDQHGRQLRNGMLNTGINQLDMRGMAKGIYFLQIGKDKKNYFKIVRS